MKDYKEAISERTYELAIKKYGRDFYDLTNKQQLEICQKATDWYSDQLASEIDLLMERRI